MHRLIQPQRRTELGDVLRRGVVPGNQRRWVAGRQAQQQEHEQHHHTHHRDRRQNALYDIVAQGALLLLDVPENGHWGDDHPGEPRVIGRGQHKLPEWVIPRGGVHLALDGFT